MRVLCMLRADKNSEAGEICDPEMMVKMGDFLAEITKAGVLLATEGLQPSSRGVRVRYTGERFIVTDGPFAETKELIASFALLQVSSMTEAIAWTTRFAKVIGACECELRPVQEAEDFPADILPAEQAAREEAWREQMQQNTARM